METGLQKLITSEEDDDEEMEMDVKEEDGGDDEDGEKHVDASQMMAGVDGEMPTISNDNNRLQQHHQFQEQVGTPGGGGARRCRPMEEKERTKLRERQCRAITARILAGLRRHGNYNLRVRADINDGPRLAGVNSAAVTSSSSQLVSPRTPASLKGVTAGFQSPGELNACNTKGVYLPSLSTYDLPSSARSQGSSIVGDGAGQTESHPLIGGSMDNVGNKQIVDIPLKLKERDFSSTAYIPVYVMLPLGVINMKCELVDPDGLLKQLRVLKSVNVDGVIVNCWWGIVEGHAPQEYNWNGYKRLFQMVRELKLKLQVVMSFHECGGNVGDDVCIPLPHWVAEIGRSNPDIFFTDREGTRNPECLSWGIDKKRVLRGRTAVEVLQSHMMNDTLIFLLAIKLGGN